MKPTIPAHQVRPEYHARVANMYMPPEYTAEQVKAKRLRFAALIQEREDGEKKEAAHASGAANAVIGKASARAACRPNAPSLAPPLPRVISKAEQASTAVAYSKKNSVSVVQALKTLGFAS